LSAVELLLLLLQVVLLLVVGAARRCSPHTHDDAVCSSVVAAGDGPEALLAGCVPLQGRATEGTGSAPVQLHYSHVIELLIGCGPQHSQSAA
jgi:hypothetical protein